MTHDDATRILRRTAATLLRMAHTYQAEGFNGAASALFTQALDLHLVVTELECAHAGKCQLSGRPNAVSVGRD